MLADNRYVSYVLYFNLYYLFCTHLTHSYYTAANQWYLRGDTWTNSHRAITSPHASCFDYVANEIKIANYILVCPRARSVIFHAHNVDELLYNLDFHDSPHWIRRSSEGRYSGLLYYSLKKLRRSEIPAFI